MKRGVQIDKDSHKQTSEIVVYLLRKKFFPANSYGRALTVVRQEDSLGILWTPPALARPDVSLWSSFARKESPVLIAQLSFVGADGAVAKRWSLCVFGQSYVKIAQKLADDLSKEFDVKIVQYLHQRRESKMDELIFMVKHLFSNARLKIAKST